MGMDVCDYSVDQNYEFLNGESTIVEQWVSGEITSISEIDDLTPLARVDTDEEELLEILEVEIDDDISFEWLEGIIDEHVYIMNECLSTCKENLVDSNELSEDEYSAIIKTD